MNFLLVLLLLGTNGSTIELHIDGFKSSYTCKDTREWFKGHPYIMDGKTIYKVESATCTRTYPS